MRAMAEAVDAYTIRAPEREEAPAIKALIDQAAREGHVLPRAMDEIFQNLHLFRIYVTADGVGGCCALHPDTTTLAEIRSLVVRSNLRGQRVGSKLVDDSVDAGRALGFQRLYALTRTPRFFESLHFYQIDMGELPQKVFKDCLRCALYPNCDEVAMVRDIGGSAAVGPKG